MFVRSTMNMGKLLSIFGLIVLVLAALSACSQSSSPGGTQGNQGPIKIGLSVSLSGDFSSDGKYLKQGYELWAATVNKNGGLLGRQVQLDILNDNSDPKQATTDYQKLISIDHVDLVVGPFGFEALPAARVAARNGYAFIEGAGSTPDMFQQSLNNIFSVSLSTQNSLASFALYVLSLPPIERPKSVAYVTADDTFARPPVDVAKKLLDAGGITSTMYKTYPDETTDFTPIAKQVAQSGAEVVIMGNLGIPDCSAFIQTFKQQHFSPKALIAAAGPDQGGDFIKAIGMPSTEGIFVPNGGWWPAIKTYQNDQFVHDYVAKYGGTPDAISSDTVQAYATGQVLEQAVNKIHSINNAALMQELRKDTFNSLQGPVRFQADGQNSAAVAYLFQWQKGQLIPVYPSNQAAANPLFPKPAWP